MVEHLRGGLRLQWQAGVFRVLGLLRALVCSVLSAFVGRHNLHKMLRLPAKACRS